MSNLAHIRDVEIVAQSMGSILVMSKFSEVFLNDFPGMPTDRNIDICIDIEPYSRPISLLLYRMVPAE